MAKIVEDTIVIKISRIAKDQAALEPITANVPELVVTIETVLAELIGPDSVVEVIVA